MNRINVTLHIIPDDVMSYDLEDFDELQHGKVRSTSREIKVNKVADGYSIVYTDNVFNELDARVFAKNMIRIFQTNVPNSIIDMKIFYHFELDNGEDSFDYETAENILGLNELLIGIRNQMFRYHASDSMNEIIEYMQDDENDEEEDDDWDMFDPRSHYDDDDDDEDDPFESLDRALRGHSTRHKNSKTREYYGRSKVMKNAKNPKRAYKRHGVLVADDKDDLRKDEKIIKEFLKDFIPGNSDWKKDFRRDVLKRWMKMYALSKKNLKKLDREYRKANASRKSTVNTEKALDFTRRLFNVPVDRWNDPSR